MHSGPSSCRIHQMADGGSAYAVADKQVGIEVYGGPARRTVQPQMLQSHALLQGE